MIKNSGFPFPNKRITVNLAPADIRKEGPSYLTGAHQPDNDHSVEARGHQKCTKP